jgi:hypothetical protein
MEEIECQNCSRFISSQNIFTHVAYCSRIMQKCNRCLRIIEKTEYYKHITEDHELKDCVFCKGNYEKQDGKEHIEKCLQQFEICEFCGLNIKIDLLEEHGKLCGSRTKKCDNCSLNCILRDFKEHEELCLQIITKVTESNIRNLPREDEDVAIQRIIEEEAKDNIRDEVSLKNRATKRVALPLTDSEEEEYNFKRTSKRIQQKAKAPEKKPPTEIRKAGPDASKKQKGKR